MRVSHFVAIIASAGLLVPLVGGCDEDSAEYSTVPAPPAAGITLSLPNTHILREEFKREFDVRELYEYRSDVVPSKTCFLSEGTPTVKVSTFYGSSAVFTSGEVRVDFDIRYFESNAEATKAFNIMSDNYSCNDSGGYDGKKNVSVNVTHGTKDEPPSNITATWISTNSNDSTAPLGAQTFGRFGNQLAEIRVTQPTGDAEKTVMNALGLTISPFFKS